MRTDSRRRGWTCCAAALLLASQAATAVVPGETQGRVERPVATPGYGGSPIVGRGYAEQPAYAPGGYFEGHPGAGGQLWILDRQSGRVRSCAAVGEGQRPRCSPWSE